MPCPKVYSEDLQTCNQNPSILTSSPLSSQIEAHQLAALESLCSLIGMLIPGPFPDQMNQNLCWVGPDTELGHLSYL